jgi:HNH endonuclease
VHFLFDVIQTMPSFANSLRLDDRGLDIAALEYDTSLDATTRKQLIDARIGQGIYRQQLEKLWGGKCAVLGITNRRVLRASHVKAWKYANNQERLDPHNGLLLAAHLDALFDALLNTFTPSGDVIIADEFTGADRKLLIMGSRLMHKPSPKLQSYLRYHRDAFETRHGKLRNEVHV